jgi:hypothetical protein
MLPLRRGRVEVVEEWTGTAGSATDAASESAGFDFEVRILLGLRHHGEVEGGVLGMVGAALTGLAVDCAGGEGTHGGQREARG